MDPDKALYKMEIVLGHEETGPIGYTETRRVIVPYTQ